MKLLISLLTLAIALPANAIPLYTHTPTGTQAYLACARETVNVRAAITTDDPVASVAAVPIHTRTVIGTLQPGECRYLNDTPVQYTPSGGYTWVNLLEAGWVAREYLDVTVVTVEEN